MTIDSFRISNFANIGDFFLELADLTALVGPNNYGKSNVLKAVGFATKFIEETTKKKREMITDSVYAPLKKVLTSEPCRFEIQGQIDGPTDRRVFRYVFSFKWDDGITEERLEFRSLDSQRFTKYMERKDNKAKYISTRGGRCNKSMEVSDDLLALNKLSNMDDLFYIEEIKQVSRVDVKIVDTLNNPDSYFSLTDNTNKSKEYSTAFPTSKNIAFFIYSLKMISSDVYELFCDAVRQMLPNIESIEAIKINLTEPRSGEPGDTLYDLRIKEKNNTIETSISRASSGSKKIVYLIALILAAEINKIPLLTLEELENSVHPRLLQALLSVLVSLAGDTKILTTSHSPFLIKYLNSSQIYLGLPEKSNLADFHKLKQTRLKKVIKLASAQEISMGEYLFEMMLDMHDDEVIYKEYFI